MSDQKKLVPEQFIPDPTHLDHLLEQWRVLSHEYNALEDVASRLEEGRSIVLAEEILALMEQGMSKAKAEQLARAGTKFREYVRRMHDARRAANDSKVELNYADRLYWRRNNSEAQMRAEMRMTK